MKIAIEAQRIFRKKKHGMDFVALELIRTLQKIDTVNEYYILIAPGKDKCLFSSANFHIIEIGYITNYCFWEQIVLPHALKRINPDVVHCTSNTAPIYCPYPLVLTLHDIIFLEKKIGVNSSLYQNLGRIYRRFVVPRVVKKAKRVITVSDYEKKQIMFAVDSCEEKITTVYNGVAPEFRPMKDIGSIANPYISAQHYWFLLGNTDPKKNLKSVLQAYAAYVSKSVSPKYLLIADLETAYLTKLLSELEISSIKEYIFSPGYISHKDLPLVYNNCFAFLYPSLRESFGLPVLEAMACGKPVITSQTSALPEIAGNYAIMINPKNVEEITEAMLLLENSQDLYDKQVEYGLVQSKKYTWRQTATQIFEIYKQIINE